MALGRQRDAADYCRISPQKVGFERSNPLRLPDREAGTGVASGPLLEDQLRPPIGIGGDQRPDGPVRVGQQGRSEPMHRALPVANSSEPAALLFSKKPPPATEAALEEWPKALTSDETTHPAAFPRATLAICGEAGGSPRLRARSGL